MIGPEQRQRPTSRDVRCKNVYEFSHSGVFIGQFELGGGFKDRDRGSPTPTPRGIVMDEERQHLRGWSSAARRLVVFNRQGPVPSAFLPQQIDMNDGRGLAIDTTHDFPLRDRSAPSQRPLSSSLRRHDAEGDRLADRQLQTSRPTPSSNSIRFPGPSTRPPATSTPGDHLGIPKSGGFNSSLQPLAGFASTPRPAGRTAATRSKDGAWPSFPADGHQSGAALRDRKLRPAGADLQHRLRTCRLGGEAAPAFLGKFGTRA